MINELSSVKTQGIPVGAIHESSRTIDLVFLISVNIVYRKAIFIIYVFLKHLGNTNLLGRSIHESTLQFLHFTHLVYSSVNHH